MRFETRPATLADLDAMLEISTQTQREHSQRQPAKFLETDPPASADIARKVLSHSGWEGAVFVATSGGQIVGHAGFYVLEAPAPGQKHDLVGSVFDISVRPAFRQSGVARALMTDVRQAAERLGVTLLQAQVWHGNDASETMFSKAGFAPISTYFEKRLGQSMMGTPRGGGGLSWSRMIWPAITLIAVLVIALVASG